MVKKKVKKKSKLEVYDVDNIITYKKVEVVEQKIVTKIDWKEFIKSICVCLIISGFLSLIISVSIYSSVEIQKTRNMFLIITTVFMIIGLMIIFLELQDELDDKEVDCFRCLTKRAVVFDVVVKEV